ncbi:hypothetical protein [Agrobacterium tumefaciens]|uniref:hypothetical protein n=1 Tax=Agrobacterium tumefaciens TaxID=358 RepID=UPI0015727616|nr:hypothetical protein [Agrobacterium tumefaciens]NSX92645.1 hypothetical protein [Agrobacterium tumefaciens]NSX92706.1 hypothetical protein [Agrobacterium tumefaciens]
MTGLIELGALIISSLATTVAGANLLYLGTYALAYAGLAFGAYALQSALTPKPKVPKPEDGSYNLKQNVPSLPYVLGRVKKGGDYAFLEEAAGVAHHITVFAAHRCNAFLRHYLHDENVILDTDGGVISGTTYFNNTRNVLIQTRLGLAASTVYTAVRNAFPTIWTNDHRGDGLATIWMRVRTVSQKNHMTVFPNQMPEHSAVLEGAWLYDPRKANQHVPGQPDTWDYSENLALMRLWHLTHPVGGKLTLDDMYLPDWIDAANVCDEAVTNRAGDVEARYHGGFWFRANNEVTEVGRIMDQAAELVVFERPDGLVGVHPGRFVEPDIRLTADDIISVQLDGNTRDASTVLAVRGRFVDTGADYVTVDAAIYGNPYQADDDTERTKTLENAAIQSHNHCQRLQKISFIRANAPKVSVLAHYESAEDVPYRRFVSIHYPPKLEEVVVEITATPKVSLRNMTVEFSGIIVPRTLYSFVAAIEEGVAPNSPGKIDPSGVPAPLDFLAVIQTEVVSGGATAAFARATWTEVSEVLTYEFEWEPTNGSEPPRSVISEEGQSEVRSSYLVDGAEYRFRLRAWGGGTPSAWTDYQIATATADPVAPGPVTDVSVTEGAGQALFEWTAPNSANFYACRIYVGTTNVLADAVLVATEYGPPSAIDSRTVVGLAAGDYYGFLVAINPSGRPAAAAPTGIFTVS